MVIMDYQKIGSFILTIRKEKNLTQKQLAEKLHITDRAILNGKEEFPKQKDIKKQPVFTCLQTKEYCY